MNLPSKLFYLIRELGPDYLFLYGRYRLSLVSGRYRSIRKPPFCVTVDRLEDFTPFFNRLSPDSVSAKKLRPFLESDSEHVLEDADGLLDGNFRIYGSEPVPLDLCPPVISHWTKFRMDTLDGRDIKDTWEPARFSWAYTLCRAYYLTGNEKYAEKFWELTDLFIKSNPVDQGPNWISAQEAAMRIINFVFPASLLLHSPSSTEPRLELLLNSIIDHTGRIPPTLAYARAQNNNHLLVEAAGLITAGTLFSSHPAGREWLTLGWKWFHHALQNQIFDNGVYIQQSTCYHRLMLQTAVWVYQLSKINGLPFPSSSLDKLSQAVRWLAVLVDPVSGHVPNLGHNDGAYLMPLTGDYLDYRPVIQAAGRQFLAGPVFPPGPWDEMSTWLNLSLEDSASSLVDLTSTFPSINRIGNADTWAVLRAENYNGRPAHADQLHVDLWWQGTNLTLDAGTYRYNAPAPFNNSMVHTGLHNTVKVENQDQMILAGKFLWLRWAQAETLLNVENPSQGHVAARHYGYRSLGVTHRRDLIWDGFQTWTILDEITSTHSAACLKNISLNWLFPNFPWKLEGQKLVLLTPAGSMIVQIEPIEGEYIHSDIRLVSAGQVISGTGVAEPYRGWFSPTYGKILPALSLSIHFQVRPPVKFQTMIILGGHSSL